MMETSSQKTNTTIKTTNTVIKMKHIFLAIAVRLVRRRRQKIT